MAQAMIAVIAGATKFHAKQFERFYDRLIYSFLVDDPIQHHASVDVASMS